jgi:hypothetical protein
MYMHRHHRLRPIPNAIDVGIPNAGIVENAHQGTVVAIAHTLVLPKIKTLSTIVAIGH